MPYVLKLGSNREPLAVLLFRCQRLRLMASQNPEPMVWYQDGRLVNRDGSRLELYRTAFVGEFGLGATEIAGAGAAARPCAARRPRLLRGERGRLWHPRRGEEPRGQGHALSHL